MPIRYKCQKCGATLKIKDELAGKRGKCPKCRTAFRVPKPESAAVAKADEAKTSPEPKLSPEEEEAFRHLTAELGEATPQKETKPTAATGAAKGAGQDEEYFRANPTAAADVAGELLSLTGRKAQGSDWRAALRQPFQHSRAAEAYREYVWQTVQKVVLVVVVCVLLGVVGWWLGNKLVGGGSNLPPLAPVTGVVTLNGEPLVDATVEFSPIPEPGQPAPGSASFGRTDENGLYELQYKKGVPGAVIGKHRVRIEPSLRSRVLLPPKYNERSTLIREVKPGRNVFNFHLKSRL